MGSGSVFISYASEDQETADALVVALEHGGIACWIATRDVAGGSDYGAAIVGAIRSCEQLLLLFSEHANGSDHVLREVDSALRFGKPIVPLRLDHTALSDGLDYRLCTVQWIDGGLPLAPHAIERTRAVLSPERGPESLADGRSGVSAKAGGGRDASIARTSSPDDQRPPRRGSGRAELYRGFWSRYLERVRAEQPDWTRARKPSDKHWMSATGPIPGTLLMPLFRKDGRIGHDIYIDTGDADSTKEIFRRLLGARSQIEEAYGYRLEWLELPDRRASRVADESSGSIEEVERHEEFLDWFVDRGLRMRGALSAYLQGETQPPAPAASSKRSGRSFAEVLAAGSDQARELDRRIEAWAREHDHTYEVAAASRGLHVDGRLLGRLYPQWDAFALRLKTLMGAGATEQAAEVRGLLAEIQPDSVAAVEPNLSCDVAIDEWAFVEEELLPTFAAMLRELPRSESRRGR